MSSPIRPASATKIVLRNELPGVPVIASAMAQDNIVEPEQKVFSDAETQKSP